MRVSQRDRLGSGSQASRCCASDSNGTINIPLFCAAKGSRGGWYRRRCVLRHPHRTPWVPNGTGQRCVGRNVIPRTILSWLLAKWDVGESEEAGPRERLSAYRPWMGDADGSSKWRRFVGTGAPRSLSQPGECQRTPWPLRRRG